MSEKYEFRYLPRLIVVAGLVGFLHRRSTRPRRGRGCASDAGKA